MSIMDDYDSRASRHPFKQHMWRVVESCVAANLPKSATHPKLADDNYCQTYPLCDVLLHSNLERRQVTLLP